MPTESESPKDLIRRLFPYHVYVKNVRHLEPDDNWLLIDRRTIWGNHHAMKNDSPEERYRVVAAYEWDLVGTLEMLCKHDSSVDLLAPIRDHLLNGGVLACWCHPKLCHGQVLAMIALREHEGTDVPG